MRYLEAIMYERVLEMNQVKSVRNLPAGLIGEETLHSNQTYPVATLEVRNRQVNNKEKVMMNKKVWTKLANGLHAWRMRRVLKSKRGGNHSSNSDERVTLSAKATKRKVNDNLDLGSKQWEIHQLRRKSN